MKTLLLIIGMSLSIIFVANCQNYMGLNQTTIIKRYGTPDFKGVNYIVYFDLEEDGINTYFFDDKNICSSFVLTRPTNYLSNYQKLLKREFNSTLGNIYIYKSKKVNLKAELTKSTDEFQIRIANADDNCITWANADN
jgi:hypothetical protein